MAKAGIYLIFCKPTGEKYVGSSIDLPRRFKEHRYELRHGLHDNPRLMAEWEHHTEDGFEFTILERVVNLDQLLAREQYWMDTLKPTLNIAPFAIHPALGTKHSQESKDKMSASGKLAHDRHSPERKEKIRQHVKVGWQAWWDSLTEDERLEARKRRSRPHTEETKRLLSEKTKANSTRRGKKFPGRSPETLERMRLATQSRWDVTKAERDAEKARKQAEFDAGREEREAARIEKVRIANTGKKRTLEQKEHLRQVGLAQQADPEYKRKHQEAVLAKMQDPEVLKRLSEAHKGKIISAEQREKIRLSNIGKHSKPRSEEAKRRMSEAQQKRRARDKQK